MFGIQRAPECPGFCARYPVGNDSSSWSDCGPCEWGSREVAAVCTPCQEDISLYDWFYLLFTALIPTLAHCFFVHFHLPRTASLLHESYEILCCVVECIVAGAVSLLVFPPTWSFRLWGCHKSNIREWYPALHNPVVNYIKPLRCSYEIVFPLYSLPFVFLLALLLSVLLFRSLLYIFVLKRRRDAKGYYYALLTLPKIAIFHALLAGVMYAAFPFLLATWSLGANAVHLALIGRAPISTMLKRLFTSPMHFILLLVNMALLAFAIIAFVAPSGSTTGYLMLLIVPVPPIFFISTMGFSHPAVLSDV